MVDDAARVIGRSLYQERHDTARRLCRCLRMGTAMTGQTGPLF